MEEHLDSQFARIWGRHERMVGIVVLLLGPHTSGLWDPRTGCPLWKKYTLDHSFDDVGDHHVLVVDTLDRSGKDVLGPQWHNATLPLPHI